MNFSEIKWCKILLCSQLNRAHKVNRWFHLSKNWTSWKAPKCEKHDHLCLVLSANIKVAKCKQTIKRTINRASLLFFKYLFLSLTWCFEFSPFVHASNVCSTCCASERVHNPLSSHILSYVAHHTVDQTSMKIIFICKSFSHHMTNVLEVFLLTLLMALKCLHTFTLHGFNWTEGLKIIISLHVLNANEGKIFRVNITLWHCPLRIYILPIIITSSPFIQEILNDYNYSNYINSALEFLHVMARAL